MSREAVVNAMLAGSDLEGQVVARVRSATGAFSVAQLRRMQRVGVRFWGAAGVPPPFAGMVETPPLTTAGAYLAEIRTIRVRANAHTSDVRHEVAHAWDHVRTGRVTGNPAAMNERGRRRVVTRPVRMWSELPRRHRVGAERMTIEQMLERYRGRARTRESAFDNPATREGYSRTHVREFYAEGWSVLLGTSRDSQVRLWLRAPELFGLMHREARGHGLSVVAERDLEDRFEAIRAGRP